jgi:peptidoglycan/LPS O-acetylase OafA/YrhL
MFGQGEIRSLTGLRGVAACWVVLFHYIMVFHQADLIQNLSTESTISLTVTRAILLHGYLAVDLFFVLSGFVMALTYSASFRARLSVSAYLDFLSKRLGRVYPLYIALTAAIAVLGYAGVSTFKAPTQVSLASNVLLVQAWGIADSIDIPAWSISTEFASYLLFPLLVRIVLAKHWVRCWAAAAAAAMILVLVATRTTTELHQLIGGTAFRAGPLDASRFATAYPLLRCLAGFTLGLFAFRLAQAAPVRRVLAGRFVGDVGLIALLALMAVPGSDVVLVLLFVPFVIALATGQSYTARHLSGNVLYWLGLVSYSIYLTHFPVEDWLQFPLRAKLDALHVPHAVAVSGAAMILPVLALSTMTYYGIERPGRDWTRRVLGKRSAPPIASEPAAP